METQTKTPLSAHEKWCRPDSEKFAEIQIPLPERIATEKSDLAYWENILATADPESWDYVIARESVITCKSHIAFLENVLKGVYNTGKKR